MVNLPTAGVDFHAVRGRGASSYGPREQGTGAIEFFYHHQNRLHLARSPQVNVNHQHGQSESPPPTTDCPATLVRHVCPRAAPRSRCGRQAEQSSGVGVALPVFIAKAGGGVLIDVDGNSLIDMGSESQ